LHKLKDPSSTSSTSSFDWHVFLISDFDFRFSIVGKQGFNAGPAQFWMLIFADRGERRSPGFRPNTPEKSYPCRMIHIVKVYRVPLRRLNENRSPYTGRRWFSARRNVRHRADSAMRRQPATAGSITLFT
jgi:hypothetical protein